MIDDGNEDLPPGLIEGLTSGRLAPYLGPGMAALCDDVRYPVDMLALAGVLSSRVSVPGKIRTRLTAVAQFIENFKHRKTLMTVMDEAFAAPATPSSLHVWLAQRPTPLIVDTWYDDTMRLALREHASSPWAEVQGLSQSEHFGVWTGWYDRDGAPLSDVPSSVDTVLYRPWGGRQPASNYLISDSDFVEVLTEIDIQTPIPQPVQTLRSALGFVFLGCRFNDQLPRAFARQILKRSGGPHYAVLPDEPTRMEQRFLEEMGIERIAMPLDAFSRQLLGPLVQVD